MGWLEPVRQHTEDEERDSKSTQPLGKVDPNLPLLEKVEQNPKHF
jgi:hypothetical protein